MDDMNDYGAMSSGLRPYKELMALDDKNYSESLTQGSKYYE